MSEGDKDEKLSPEEYLNMIRLDLINRHKPIEGLNNNDNNNNNTDNNTNTNTTNNNNTEHREWKVMLRMYIKCISTKSFNETRTMHQKSK